MSSSCSRCGVVMWSGVSTKRQPGLEGWIENRRRCPPRIAKQPWRWILLLPLSPNQYTTQPQPQVDQIYHLACPASPPHYQYNPIKTIKTSTMGTLNMLVREKRKKGEREREGKTEIHPTHTHTHPTHTLSRSVACFLVRYDRRFGRSDRSLNRSCNNTHTHPSFTYIPTTTPPNTNTPTHNRAWRSACGRGCSSPPHPR
jgi:hypothetical protein